MTTRGEPGPTLAAIARAAGVSVPTASKVINDRDGVAPETRVRVLKALDRLGYVRRRRRGARPTLVELVADRLETPWSGAVLRAVEQAAGQAGIGLLVSSPGAVCQETGDPAWLRRYRSGRSDGVLFCLNVSAPAVHVRLERNDGLPFVLIDPGLRPPARALSVSAENRRGGACAAAHLLDLGHRRFAVIGGRPASLPGRERVEGFQSALREAGLPDASVAFGDFDEARAGRLTAELMGRPTPPTALFACNDRMARGACAQLAALGLRVPDDVSVVGFDGLPGADWPGVRLTTVRQPVTEMAATAVRLLLALVAGDQPEAVGVELATRLVVGDTTAPPVRVPLPKPRG
ncbi:LacI family DNA-binding transcriptional regulator [Streptomyces radicis]|uniref:LacI family transcriptional regulator n=1 Tax=Streptomyces radicis TaxID=1750517 RepID=A0A3A9WEC1_9ACTN|nr:LacI family DNA-binding transcriptional regulator [Streptomyces radicis]RKN05996.1 LacI family transcriptional regulator [Streptomyces radicis]RKN17696.1 LacI family transcriptional regulator [Streptomyces radicis]